MGPGIPVARGRASRTQSITGRLTVRLLTLTSRMSLPVSAIPKLMMCIADCLAFATDLHVPRRPRP